MKYMENFKITIFNNLFKLFKIIDCKINKKFDEFL